MATHHSIPRSRSASRTLLALVLPAFLVAGACGGDSDDSADTAEVTTSAPGADTGASDTDGSASADCESPGISTESIEPTEPTVAADPEPFTADATLAGESVTLYSGRDEELIQPLIDRFTERTGIEVEVRYGNSAEMGAQLLEEGDGTSADVFYSQEVGAVGVLAKADLLSELPEELVELVDERFRPGDGREWVGVTGRSRVIVYNPELLEDVPQCVAELVDPAFKGQVAIVPSNAGFQAFITGFRVSEGDDAAKAWLEAMIANDVVTDIASNGDVLDAVNAGDVPIGLINHYYWARHEDRDNLTAQLVFPTGDDPGGLVNATAAALTKQGADNPAALALVEFLLSPEGQTFFVNETWEYPVIDGIADPAGVPPMSDLEGPGLELTDLDSLEATQALLAEVGLDIS